MNYYNEFDHAAAEWLRQLIEDGLIPKGEVDERSIADVRANDLVGYTQCHFFAGIGGWPLSLQLAGWPDDRPVWTGSCPCQPFSTAGKRKGYEDERDLWPVFANLIRQCRPQFVFGEQVENAIRHGWLDRVYADMEREGYAVGAHVLGAHSVGAPHRRYRLYWGAVSVADGAVHGRDGGLPGAGRTNNGGKCRGLRKSSGTCNDGGMAEDSNGGRCGGWSDGDQAGRGRQVQTAGLGDDCGVDDSESIGRGVCNAANVGKADGEIDASANSCRCGCRIPGEHRERVEDRGSGGVCRLAANNGKRQQEQCGDIAVEQNEQREAAPIGAELRSLSNLPWLDSRFVYCRDGKVRRIPAESLLFGVADGLPEEVDGGGIAGISEDGGFPLTTQKEGRAMLLKGYGNAIVPQVAAAFIAGFEKSVQEVL